MLGLGVGVLAKLIWDAFNWRPVGRTEVGGEGTEVTVKTGANDFFRIRYSSRQQRTDQIQCSNGTNFGPFTGGQSNIDLQALGVGYVVGKTSHKSFSKCGAGANVGNTTVAAISVRKANGSLEAFATIQGGGTTWAQTYSFENDFPVTNISALYAGNVFTPVVQIPGTYPDNDIRTRPATPDAAATTAPSPSIEPASPPVPLPAAVPGSVPVPAPARDPGGLAAGQIAAPPEAATVPNLVRTVTTSSPGSQTQTITAGGVSQAPAAPIVPVTPAEAVLIGSQLVGGPGSTPPQGPGGTAAELGRLEGKSELALSKLGQLAPLLESIDVLQALGEWLLSANNGVTYTLQPPCGTDANGDPLPPVEVVVPPTIGVEVATLARLDALAMLIDEHKQMRQPICKGKPTGSPVTVTAVEVE